MSAIQVPPSESATPSVKFPPTLGQLSTSWYFSRPFQVTRPTSVDCGNVTSQYPGSALVFPPGVDGTVLQSGYLAKDGGWGEADIVGSAHLFLKDTLKAL